MKPIKHNYFSYVYKAMERLKRKEAALRIQRRQRRKKSIPIYDINLPKCKLADKIRERIAASILELGKSKVLRMFILRILLSKATVPLIVLRKRLR